jgi:transcriptional regulator with XRE-family HTH domain
MELFADAFRKAKAAKNATLREISDATGKSIGYLSDVLHKRKGAPDLEIVAKIERCLDIKDHRLMASAKNERLAKPSNLARRVKARPILAEALMRMEDMSDEELGRVLSELPGNYLLFEGKGGKL